MSVVYIRMFRFNLFVLLFVIVIFWIVFFCNFRFCIEIKRVLSYNWKGNGDFILEVMFIFWLNSNDFKNIEEYKWFNLSVNVFLFLFVWLYCREYCVILFFILD